MRTSSLLKVLFIAAQLAGCASASDGAADMNPGADMHPPPSPLIVTRPYESKAPSSYDGKTPLPLVILLHGYGASGLVQDLYFGLGELVDRFGFLYAYPDGTLDSSGKRFWNATDACCDFGNSGIDDVAYVDAVISDMSTRYNVDRRRIFLVGHSNGGFMSHRFACDRASRVAAIVSLAGANYKDASKCQPSEPVAILQVHGDKDDSVPYTGGMLGALSLPSAEETVAGWAKKNGCAALPDRSPAALDLETNLPGAETSVARWPSCKPGGAAELWTIVGGGHVPTFARPTWGEKVWGFLSAHPKPAAP
jgi:polyhydroxybutyrate depolymerase